jgi:hypothetical protein
MGNIAEPDQEVWDIPLNQSMGNIAEPDPDVWPFIFAVWFILQSLSLCKQNKKINIY